MNTLDIALTEVDTLGLLLAQIADLTEKADAIKAGLKDALTAPGAAESAIEGNLYRAAVVSSNRSTTDWKKLAADLGIAADQIAAYTKTAAVYSVRVTSR
jgi:hypothetical protein